MWRSKARAFLLLKPSILRSPPSQVLSKTLTLIPAPPPMPTPTHFRTLRSFSSTNHAFSSDYDPKNPNGSSESAAFEAGGENPSGSALNEKETSPNEVEGDSLSSLWEESINGDDADSIFAAESKSVVGAADESEEFDIDEEVDHIRSVIETCPADQIERTYTKLAFHMTEEVLSRVFKTTPCSAEKFIAFFKIVAINYPFTKNLRTVGFLVDAISLVDELEKKDAYMLWDLIKEIGKEKGLVTTEVLNSLISMFWKLGKAKAALEVFEKFDEFGCSPDGNTYYFTIEALGRRSMIDTAWSVCEKMINSGRFPDGEKMGEIVLFFCRGGKPKEAHLVYLAAKESKVSLSASVFDFLVGALSKKDETIYTAMELLEDYPKESLKYANKSFASVIHGLCKVKDVKEAKKLLLRMVNVGPAPGNAAFNYVITALSKAGEMDDAKNLLKVMDSRGLRPDVYAYTVIMSGYAKGGLLDEAHEILREAKRIHQKLSPVTYHILIRGYCKMEQFEKALECLNEMKEDGMQPNTDEYNKLIQSLCLKAMDWRTAEKLLEEMTESGLYLKGITRSLIAAVKELEEEEIGPAISAET
ncbi:pentatricopeptide repeat-containing protein At3g02650, mitochondrial [Ananas comosus]|uniref:Pentatricopeptide repeat-containing protein At3g02650, mitochondrial n=1 Tax=Ananas comosus TaxID=4615 RepID=A0A6P5FGE8_ANACO|nr:pentatricopeptide repeat-containing protein At3g02650, mitochondrial [Ananas comosus]